MITTDNLSNGQWTPVDRVRIPVGCQAAVDWANPRALAANVAELLNGYLERVYAYPHGSNWTLPTHIVPAAPDTETLYGTILGPNQAVLSGGGPGVLSSVRDMFFMPARTLWLAPDFDPGSGFTAIGRTGALYASPSAGVWEAAKLQVKGDGDGEGVGKPYVDGTDIRATADFNLGLWASAEERAWMDIESVAGTVARWGWITCGAGGTQGSSVEGTAPPHPPSGSVWRFTWRKEQNNDMAFVAQAAAVAVMKPSQDLGLRTSVSSIPASRWPAVDTPFRYPSEPADASSESALGFGHGYDHGARYFRRLRTDDLIRCRDALRMMTRSCILLDHPFAGSVMEVSGYGESVSMGTYEKAYGPGDGLPGSGGPEDLMGHAAANQSFNTSTPTTSGPPGKIASVSLSASGSVWGTLNETRGIEYASSEVRLVTSITGSWTGAVARGIVAGLVSRVRVYLGATVGVAAGGSRSSEATIDNNPSGRGPRQAVEALFSGIQNLPVPMSKCGFDGNATLTYADRTLDNVGSLGTPGDRWLYGDAAEVSLVYDSGAGNNALSSTSFAMTLNWPSNAASSILNSIASDLPYEKGKAYHEASGQGDSSYDYHYAGGNVTAGVYPSFAVVVVDWNFQHCTLAGNG